MIVNYCSARNFASYANVEFQPAHRGLTLIQGATGSGKSTLCDIIPWGLFGATAKNGSASDVVSWTTGAETQVVIEAVVNGRSVTVTRSRIPNDLYFSLNGGPCVRGKDLKDTQKLLDAELGMTYDTFVTSSYFHEFSKTASFFTAPAKIRKEITEQIVDLSLAKRIVETTSEYRKELKTELAAKKSEASVLDSSISVLLSSIKTQYEQATIWEHNQAIALEELKAKASTFAQDREALADSIMQDYVSRTSVLRKTTLDLTQALIDTNVLKNEAQSLRDQLDTLGDTRCTECGAKKHSDKRLVLTRDLYTLETKISDGARATAALTAAQAALEKHVDRYEQVREQTNAVKSKENEYTALIEKAQKETNPYEAIIAHWQVSLAESRTRAAKQNAEISDLTSELSDIEYLNELSINMRALLVKNTVLDLQNNTNNLLGRFFDSEFRVEFVVEDNDKIEVLIIKDSNHCNYAQLSKGQRQLLKLCFGVSVMRQVETTNSIEINAVYFDEALDGLSDELKIKAFYLFESLQQHYGSIFVVDHCESLKSMFTNKIEVTLTDEGSVLNEEA